MSQHTPGKTPHFKKPEPKAKAKWPGAFQTLQAVAGELNFIGHLISLLEQREHELLEHSGEPISEQDDED